MTTLVTLAFAIPDSIESAWLAVALAMTVATMPMWGCWLIDRITDKKVIG